MPYSHTIISQPKRWKQKFGDKRYDGLVYLLTDDEGKKESMPIAAAELGRGLGHTAITNHIKRSKFALKTDIPKVRQRVLMAMRTSPLVRSRFEEKPYPTRIESGASQK